MAKKEKGKVDNKVEVTSDNTPLFENAERLVETLLKEPKMLGYRMAGSTVYGMLKTEVIEAVKEIDKKAYKIIMDYKKNIDKEHKKMAKRSPIYMSNVDFQEKLDKKKKPYDFNTRYLEFTHKMLMAYCYHGMQKIMDDILERAAHVPEANAMMVDVGKMRESDLYAQAMGEQLEKLVKQYVKKEIKIAKDETKS